MFRLAVLAFVAALASGTAAAPSLGNPATSRPGPAGEEDKPLLQVDRPQIVLTPRPPSLDGTIKIPSPPGLGGVEMGGALASLVNRRKLIENVPFDTSPITASDVPLATGPRRMQTVSPGSACDRALPKFEGVQELDIVPEDKLHGVKVFLEACYGTTIPLAQAYPALVPLRDRTVLLGRAGLGSHCTGFLLGPNRVLTAAHCLDEIQNPETISVVRESCASFWVARETRGALERRSIARIEQKGASLADASCPFEPFPRGRLEADIVVVQLSAPYDDIDTFRQRAQIPRLGAGTPLIVFGRQPHEGQKLRGEGLGGESRIITLRNDSCRLMFAPDSQDGRLLHQCLAVKGMSGGPVFAEDASGELRLIGIHQGAALENEQCPSVHYWCSAAHQRTKFLNVGHLVSI